MRSKWWAIVLLVAALLGGCSKDSTPNASDLKAAAQDQAKKDAADASHAAATVVDKAKETAKDVANGPDTSSKPSISIESPAEFATVTGGTVDLKVLVNGITIVKPDGDTSGKTGHFHVYIDRNPDRVGTVIPKAPDIVHSADNPIHITGLKPGKRNLIVVLGDGAHRRILDDVVAEVTVNVTA